VAQLYPWALGSFYAASYDSQGYGGGILTRPHTGQDTKSQSHFTADSQSVCLGVEPTLWTFDQILLPIQEFLF
jgi:hypothetical protein